MFKSGIDFDTEKAYKIDELELKIKTQIVDLVYVCKNNSKNLIIVTNEVGMGLVSEYRISNLFRDIQGRINQILASLSDEVNFMVSGIPLRIK
jgi:adenosylcobinamide kinase/adenosylcobinamide-phosphate guanylyltransferase